MKKILLCFLSIFIIIFGVTACSNNSKNKETNPLINKIYMHNTPLEKTFDFDYIKFYNDNTFQGVKIDSFTKTNTGELKSNCTSYYGTYEINENALTLNISNNNFSGAIINNGNTISFGNNEFINCTEHINNSDPLLSEFKQ